MGDEQGHFGDADLDELHVVAESTARDAGACLTGHLSSFLEFKNKKSCNYRWQCYVGNKASAKIRDRLHAYDVKKARIRTDYTITNPADKLSNYCFYVPRPNPGDWDIGGPPKDIKRTTFLGEQTEVPAGQNFTGWIWPYFNNAHHIIPKGTLRAEIAGSDYSDMIQKGLLKAKYNVNHKINMIFLPMDKRIGTELRLPRHLEYRGKQSHPDYDGYAKKQRIYEDGIENGLREVIAHYEEKAKNAKKNSDGTHAIPDVRLSKKKLEDLSEQLLDDILAWGEYGGDSLDERAREDEEIYGG